MFCEILTPVHCDIALRLNIRVTYDLCSFVFSIEAVSLVSDNGGGEAPEQMKAACQIQDCPINTCP